MMHAAYNSESGSQDGQRVVLITGGSSGVGEAAAIEFAKFGYRVVVSGSDEQKLQETIAKLQCSVAVGQLTNNRFFAIKAEFEDLEQVEKLIEKVITKFQRLDVLLNSAEYFGQNCDLVDENFFQDFQNVLQVNLISAARLAQIATPHLISSPRGVIINSISELYRADNPNLSYCVSKAGLTMFTKTLANELEGTQVRVVAVVPGTTRLAPPVDSQSGIASSCHTKDVQGIASVIRFLESDKASFIHGSVIDLDGDALARSTVTSHKSSIQRENWHDPSAKTIANPKSN